MTHSAISCNIADRAGDDYKFSTVMLPVLAMLLMSLLGEKPLGEKPICKGQDPISQVITCQHQDIASWPAIVEPNGTVVISREREISLSFCLNVPHLLDCFRDEANNYYRPPIAEVPEYCVINIHDDVNIHVHMNITSMRRLFCFEKAQKRR